MYTQGMTMEELSTMEAIRKGCTALLEISEIVEEMTKTLKTISETLEKTADV